MIKPTSFAEEIEANKAATRVSDEVARLETEGSRLDVRLRGAYITTCDLTSPTSGKRVSVLYADSDLSQPKISATHPMVPAGPYEGIGGQHGFPRWADYDVTPMLDTESGEKQVALNANRSDQGLALSKRFVLSPSVLTTHTTITGGENVEHTSMGEHIYFSLQGESFDGLKLNGQSLDELLGEGSLATVQNNGTLYWDFSGMAVIDFPAGHSLKVSATFQGESLYPLAMWIWKRPGSPSICFEPVVGVKQLGQEENSGITLEPRCSAVLSTKIEII